MKKINLKRADFKYFWGKIGFILLLLNTMTLSAQDVITKNDRTDIKVKVIEITDDAVKYRQWDNQNGPIYNIAKSQILLIIYQNGKKEFFTPINQTPKSSPGTTKPTQVTAQPSSKFDGSSGQNSAYIFTPRDKSKPKDKLTNYADRFGNIGVSLNSIGKTTIPSVSIINDFFFMPNAALTFGINGNYHSEEVMGYSIKATTFGAIGGAAYYFNELLKLDKTKASAYAGLALNYAYSTITSDIESANTSSGNLTVFVRGGGRYHLSKRFGLFGEIQIGKGDPAFVAGISILTFK